MFEVVERLSPTGWRKLELSAKNPVPSHPQMPPKGVINPNEYPSRDLLARLASEIDEQQWHSATPRVLEKQHVLQHPDPLGPCTELFLYESFQSAFVLSQKRSHSKRYITVTGIREYPGKGAKKVLSTQCWPRTRKTGRLRPISLHRWIAVAVHGIPVNKGDEATHICGNEACVAASHIRWQSRDQNLDEREWHHQHPPATIHGMTRRFSRLSWL